MSGEPRLTHIQRAYKIFDQMQPQLISGRGLAALMMISVSTAYDYIDRLKKLGCIEVKGGSGKVPEYGLVKDATMPAGDRRGRKPKARCEAIIDPDVLGFGTGQ
jgi:biotin operon repressor